MPCLAGMSVIHKVTRNDTFNMCKLYRNVCGMRRNTSAVGVAASLPRHSDGSGFASVHRICLSELTEPV